MRFQNRHVDWMDECGSALPAALVLITLLTTLVGILLSVYVVQYRLIRRDVHRLQARYIAESGVYAAIDSLQLNPAWRARNKEIPLPDGFLSRVTVEPFGGYLLVRSVAHLHRSESVVRALVGQISPPDFNLAMMVWDIESDVNVVLDTRITGDIKVGDRGLRQSFFKGDPFTGKIDGTVFRIPELEPPYFDDLVFTQTVSWCEDVLTHPVAVPSDEKPYERRTIARNMPAENRVIYEAGDVSVTPADTAWLREPVTLVAGGNMTLTGRLAVQPGSVFIAGKKLLLRQARLGKGNLFYGRDGVEVSAGTMSSGQYLSRAAVTVADSSYLDYPSVVYVTGEQAETTGAIRIQGKAVVNGTLVHPPLDTLPTEHRGRILIEKNAHVRGTVFNGLETEIHGTVSGSLITYQTYFYESPTIYVNWLKNVRIEVGERPVSFFLPVAFSPAPRLGVVQWEAFAD